MNGQRREPTQDELDFLYRQGFIWSGMTSTHYGKCGDWMFSNDGDIYDLSAADIMQIETIKARHLFVIKPDAEDEIA